MAPLRSTFYLVNHHLSYAVLHCPLEAENQYYNTPSLWLIYSLRNVYIIFTLKKALYQYIIFYL